jgi:hypothetical protein
MKRWSALAIFLALGCSKGGSFKAEGNVTLDGKLRTVQGCEVTGKSAELAVRLKLDDGTVVGIPIHGGASTVEPSGKPKVELNDCERRSTSGSGNEGHYKGTIGLTCKGNGAALELTLNVDCGG